MRLKISNLWATILEASATEMEWLVGYLSVVESEYAEEWKHNPETGKKMRVPTSVEHERCLLELRGSYMAFPAGMTPVVRRAAAACHIEVRVEDARCAPVLVPGQLPDWLRDYQEEPVRATIKRGRGLLQAGTGAGKTEIFIANTIVLPCEWLYVVHSIDIIEEVRKRYVRWTKERVGEFHGDDWRPGTCNVTVASFHALWAGIKRQAKGILEYLARVEAVNVDESHAQPAETFWNVTMSMPAAYYRIGQSGTPLLRSPWDNMRTIGALGPLIHRIPTQTLIERGILSRAEIRMVINRQKLIGPKTWRGVYSNGIVKSEERNRLVGQAMQVCRKPALVFVAEGQHGQALMRQAKLRGIQAEWVHGGDGIAKRNSALARLGARELEVVVCTNIFQAGVNVPEIRAIVNAQGQAAAIGTLQRLGRGIRMDDDFDGVFEVWDFYDTGNPWLNKHSESRMAAYRGEGHEVAVVEPDEVFR